MKILSAVLLAAAVSVAVTLSSYAAPSRLSGPGIHLPDPAADGPSRSTPLGPLPDPVPSLSAPALGDPPPAIDPPAPGAGYLIITDAPLIGQFERFAAWKRRQGTPTEVRTLASIRSDYRDAHDDAERIRLAIRDAYARGTRWVLLGGDTEVIPTRIVYSRFLAEVAPYDAEFPSDFYFACLDGSWNADGDDRFGEAPAPNEPGDDVDLVPEVFVGRAPVRTAAEARVFVEKTIDYAGGRAVPESRQTLFMAEVLLPDSWQPGQSPLLDFARNVDQFLRFPPGLGLANVRLFENHADPAYLPGALPENLASVLDHLGRGYPLSVFLGRGAPLAMSVGPDLMHFEDVATLRNRDALTHLIQFTSKTHDISHDCIGEEFLRNAQGGAVTSMGPSALTFAGQDAQAMQQYLRLWLSGPLETAGELAAAHRVGAFPEYAECVILLGDPQLPIFPSTPAAHRNARGTLDERDDAAEVLLASAVPRPNPTRDRVTIGVELGALAQIQPLYVAVYDLAGRRVRTLTGCVIDRNRLAATWDLRDEGGHRVDQGVYFVSIRLGEAKRVARLLVVP
jgi:hypothetical protein